MSPDHDMKKYAAECGKFDNRLDCAARELTVGELLDRRIEKAERLVRALHDLKGTLPGNFLNGGASRISPFLEL